MRKFYSLVAGVCIVLAHLQTNAQIVTDSCRADFERISSTTNNPIIAGFRALPWSSTNKKPEEICWNFGDNHDTCLKYDPALSNNYYIPHSYNHTGSYNVCVRIRYQGGCVAEKCRVIQIGESDSCSIKFETLNSTANPLGKYFVAQPWHNHNKKPVLICWNFGDNRDTCIQYSTSYAGAYSAYHLYSQLGDYNVCVKIRYDGGCEAYYCHVVQTGELRDSCSADFEASGVASTPFVRHFIAKPWHNKNKKPVYICWSFGDNHDTCIQYSNTNPGPYTVDHNYRERGRYETCVRIVYEGGCEAKKCKVIEIGEPDSCKVSFETLASTSNSLGKYFIAQPWHNHNKKPVLVCWNFGDNRDTCIQYSTNYTGRYAVFHSYSRSGSYNACVKVLYDGGCTSYYCHSVQVGEPDSCKVSFETLSSTSNKLGKYFIAKPWHNHNKKPVRICWNFGDNRDTCIEYSTSYTGAYAVFHAYLHPGTYNVCVKVRYDGGCESYSCSVVQVGEPDSCRADFERISASTLNDASRVYYRALPWNNHNKKPARICWIFGDGRDTCISYPENYTGPYVVAHHYEHPGNYEVCVRILYYGGCEAKKCKVVVIGEPDSCKISFETLSSASNKLGKYFIAKPWHNHNKKPVRICWNFGDNRDTCIEYSTSYTGPYAVFHSYLHPGNYNVCVKVRYDGGCESYNCRVVQVGEPDSCRADFERIPLSTSNDASRVYYRALPWNNHEKKPARICWSFGDGRDTCISYPENYSSPYAVGHNYEHSGSYEVCVKILYYGGCEAKQCRVVNILPDDCRVHLYEIVPAITSLTRGFYFTSSNDRRPAHICWNFGDGTDTCITIEPGATEIPHAIRHTYPGPGVYRACVKVLFANGCTASDCVEVSIRSVTGICGGYYTDSLIEPRTYLFKGFSIHKPDDAVVSYRWSFGDGALGIGQQVTHTYNVAGVYRVCLVINTEKGCETKICNDVRVAGPAQSTLQLSPNPVINVLRAVFYSTHNETVKIKIINASGIVVREYTRPAIIGSNTWEFTLSDLMPGAYSLVVQSANQFASAIFFKQ